MRTFLILMVASSLALSACSGWRDSRANPSNWFGGSRSAPAPVEAGGTVNPLIPQQTGILQRDRRETYDGTLVLEITDLVVERTSTGGIIRVTGQTALQGAFDVRLTSEDENDIEPVDGVLTFELRAIQPDNQGIGTIAGRTVRVGRYVSSHVLERTSEVRIVGAQNVRTTQRR